MRTPLRGRLLAAMVIAAGPLLAGHQVQLLLDSDHNPATGCGGVESIITVTIEGRRTAVHRQECRDSQFTVPARTPAFAELTPDGHLELVFEGAGAIRILLDSAEVSQPIERVGSMVRIRVELPREARDHAPIRGAGLLSAPVANPDSYDAVGNTLLEVGVTPSGAPAVRASDGVLANDSDAGGQPLTVSAFDAQTRLGGTVAMQPNGTFTYTPPRGISNQTDTFTYSAADTAGMKTVATVTIEIGTRVWYVRNTDLAGGNGTSSAPYNRLGLAQLAAADGDILYLFAGDGTSRGQDLGVVLKQDQRLLGQGRALFVDGVTIVPAGAAPVISNQIGPCVTVTNGNRIEGLTLKQCVGDGVTTNDAVIDSLLLIEVTISETFADGLDIPRASNVIVIGDSTIEKVTGDLARIGADPGLLVLISRSTLQDTLPIEGGDGLRLTGPRTGEMALAVLESTFRRLFGDAVDIHGSGGVNDSAEIVVNVSSSQFSSPFNDGRLRGTNSLSVKAQESDLVNVLISDNTFSGVGGGGAIMLQMDDRSTLGGTVAGNTISDPPGAGIDIEADESTSGFLSIVENVVQRPTLQGLIMSGFGTSDVFLDVERNKVANATRDSMSFSAFGGRLRLNLIGNESTSPAGSGYLLENAGGSAARFDLVGDPSKSPQQNVEQSNTGTARTIGTIVVVPKRGRGARR